MQLEIHWPEGTHNYRLYGAETALHYETLDEDVIDIMRDVVNLSYKYDVIIDNGKATFVDKE